MRKVNLENLPVKNNKIDWSNSIGVKLNFIFDDIEGVIEILDYTSKGQKIKIKYNDKELDTRTGNIQKCQLGRLFGTYNGDFKFDVGHIFKDDKRNLVIIDRTCKENKNKKEKWYRYKCNNCGWDEGWIREGTLRRGSGCACCSGNTLVEHINTIYAKAPWMMELGVSIEDAKNNTVSTRNKIVVKCPNCGQEKEIAVANIYNRKSISCNCGDGFSYPSKLMTSILMQLEIRFTREYSPSYLIKDENGNKSRKFSDFFLPDYNLVIETDGKLGHKSGKLHSKSKKTLRELIDIDKWKDEQHLKNGVKTIRIDCFESNLEYIKENILNSELNDIFDLSKIDWLKCEEFAINSNKVKEVCDRWNKRGELETINDISKELNISESATKTYIQKGVNMGWTTYNPSEEREKGKIKTSEINKLKLGKRIMVFKDGKTLGEFSSCSELERKSEELFGVKLSANSISSVCIGKNYHHKGYTFYYVHEEGSKEKALKNYDKYKNSIKNVEVFKDGVSLGVFENCVDLVKKSTELFGVEFKLYSISSVANNKSKSHMGYVFRYTNREYETNEIIKKSKLNIRGKRVEVFKGGISQGVFESTMDLQRRSMELFGVKLDSGSISSVCRGKLKTHAGYTFRYIEN